MSDLKFWKARDNSPSLVFGESETPAVVHDTLTLTDRFPELNFTATCIPTVQATVQGVFPTLTFTASSEYTSRCARPQVGQVVQPQQEAKPCYASAEATYTTSIAAAVINSLAWGYASAVHAARSASHQDTIRVRQNRSSAYVSAKQISVSRDACHQAGSRQHASRSSSFTVGMPVNVSRSAAHQDGAKLRNSRMSRYGQGAPVRAGHGEDSGAGYSLVLVLSTAWQDGIPPRPGQHTSPVIPPDQPSTWSADLRFTKPRDGSAALLFGGSTKVTAVIPVRSVYIVVNDVLLRRVSNNLVLPAANFSLKTDRDSWTWGFNATFPLKSLGDLLPDSNGDKVELEALINGTAFRVLVENISRNRQFPCGSISVTGRSKSAWLDTPYAPQKSFNNAQARTAQQLMNDALTLNGQPIGWDIDWQLTDWLIPAGAWAHQGNYISALKAIAGAAGGYIQTHPTDMSLSILPAYPVAPWEWSGITPDVELPSAVTTQEGIEWITAPSYNGVYCSGSILGFVKRSGTAGDEQAPMVVDPLITHADAARQRGLSVLGYTGEIQNVSLRLPVLPATGIITPGKMVNYVDNGEERLGIVRSTGVDVGFPEVFQTVGVESHAA